MTLMYRPVNVNRMLVTWVSSRETILLPNLLLRTGLTTSEALSLYGVLSGMALPIVLFPSAITNSLSVLLLPMVSEADASNQENRIKRMVQKTFLYAFLLGILCTIFFLIFGHFMCEKLFHSSRAGDYIVQLSFFCQLLYI